ncbi:ABC transporter substrate-binding protein [Eupransor demetentiae]|uniref:Periplasmic component (FepB) n=1 Tax=Eupransor demetentiae TaxID=3109584 RepID=A0ABM9N5D9_9LACO|nr:ABC-type Fe3+-hydroxamate transport system [Lactobacillaceae bacterium LMG 33000]
MKKGLQFVLLLALGAALLGGILWFSNDHTRNEASKGRQRTLTDIRGRKVAVPKYVQRAYYPYYYQNLLTVVGPDAFKRVVASSIYDTANYSGDLYERLKEKSLGFAKVQDVGSTLKSNFDLEKLIALKPDVVVLANYQYDAIGKANLERLKKLGIPVVFIDYTDLSPQQHYQSTEILGKLFGEERRAEEVNDNYRNHIRQVEERLQKVKQKKTAYFEQRSTGSSFAEYGKAYGDGMLMGVLAKEAGAKNIYSGKIKGTGDVNPEYLFKEQPDAIFLDGTNYADAQSQVLRIGYGVTPAETQSSLTALINQRPGFKELKAVRQGQVYALDNHLMRTMKDYVLVEYIAKMLYPNLFHDVNPAKNLEEFNEKYLPNLVDNDSVFFTKWKMAGK